MQRLRQARFLARLVLAWFALAIVVAVASPIAGPQALELVCSGGSMTLLVKADGGGPPAASHTLDCPLCASVAPPLPALVATASPQPSGQVVQPTAASRVAARPAAPLPARGPPAHPA